MTDIGTLFNELFGPLGILGGIFGIFLLFYIDAILFPTFPELFTVLAFTTQETVDPSLYGTALLVTILVAEVAGVLTLYKVIKRAKVPGRIQGAVIRYRDFLICSDERVILINRVAPILPFLGAFVALCNWDLKKSIAYVLIGGAVKYGLILGLSGFFITYMARGDAIIVTIIMVLIVVAVSFVATYFRKKRLETIRCE